MAKWISIPNDEPFFGQPIQLKFLDDRKLRWCLECKETYKIGPPTYTCPSCEKKGKRLYDRLTIIAGRRFGKTLIGSISGVDEASIPNTVGWACAPTNDKLHRYVIPAFQRYIPDDWVMKDGWSAEHQNLRLKNGSLIHFQTLEHPDQGRGQGLDWLYIDEVCELTRKHWEVIRPSLAGDTVAFFTTTPRGYDWVYEELYFPAEEGLPGYRGYRAKTKDSANPRISKEFLDRERHQMSDLMFRQEYEADFVTFTGSIYGEHLRESHILRDDAQIKKVIPDWPNISGYPVLVGLDSGADHPFGGVKLISTEAGMVVIGEYLERNRSFIEHACDLHILAASSNTKWAINKNERQPMIELGQHGIYCQPANNDQIAGIERVKSWLHNDQLFFIEKLCPRTVRQMRSYRWAENVSPKDETKRKERVHKKDDELVDALRYALMTWPRLPSPIVVTDTRRNIREIPEHSRKVVERERKIESDAKEPETVWQNDFWL